MKVRTIALAQQLLGNMPKDDVEELIKLLQYYNRFAETDRVRAMEIGSKNPIDKAIETEVTGQVKAARSNQNVYMMTTQGVCKCCGK